MVSPAVPQDPIRRRNRAVEDDAWIRDFLRRAPTCTVGMIQDGWPFLNSNLFLFDEAANAIYFHTAGTGRTRSNLEGDGRVCVSVSEFGRLLPAERASGVSAEYAGVVLFGRAVIVTDLAEMRRALEGQLDKYFPHLERGRDYAPFTDQEMLRATVYRIDIERWTAKEHREPEDFPGAFTYPTS